MKKFYSSLWKAPILIFILLFLFPLSCTKEYRVEITAEDWSYDDEANILDIYLVARDTGEIGIQNISCKVSVRSTFVPSSPPIAEKTVYFSGGEISPGSSVDEQVVFRNVTLISLVNYKVEITEVKAHPVSNSGCSNPFS